MDGGEVNWHPDWIGVGDELVSLTEHMQACVRVQEVGSGFEGAKL